MAFQAASLIEPSRSPSLSELQSMDWVLVVSSSPRLKMIGEAAHSESSQPP